MGRCDDCLKKPIHPDKKCCFNCARSGTNCEVWHNCGEDCPGWDRKVVTNADRIRAMSDEELSVFLWEFDKEETARTTEYALERRRITEWLQQPAEDL